MIDQKSYINANKEISLLELNISKEGKIEDQTLSYIIKESKKFLENTLETNFHSILRRYQEVA